MHRLGWVAVGFGLGAVAMHKATRGGRSGVLVTTAGTAAARVRRRLDDAWSEGRAEMTEREARLREVLAVEVPDVAVDLDGTEHGPRFRGRESGDRR